MANTHEPTDKGYYCAESGFILTAIRRVYMISRLMQTLLLPDRVDPWRLASESGRLDGTLALATLPRLAAVLADPGGLVHVALRFGIAGPPDVARITGGLRTELILECQRCLGPLTWPLDVAVHLGLARDDAEASRLPDEYEPLLATEGFISVADLVEDELLLALPRIPKHTDPRHCLANGYRPPFSEPTAAECVQQPFAALASLLQDTQRSH
jgi:uncharacterized protein